MTKLETMRLTYIDPHPIPDTLPATLQVLQTVDALGEIGVKTTLITPRPKSNLSPRDLLGRELSANVTIKHLPDLRNRWWFPSSSNKPFFWLAKRFLRGISTDALLVRNLKLAERLLSGGDIPPLFFETHEIFAQSYKENHLRMSGRKQRKFEALQTTEGLVYRQAKGIVAITACLAEDIRAHYGVDTPVAIAPDGVDLCLAGAVPHRIANDIPVLLYLGSLHPWKGVDTLIRALHHLNDVILWIAGGTDERIAELRNLAAGEAVETKVSFLGQIPPVERFNIINKADICLLPLAETSIGSRYTSPLKLFEYMGMGKPVIASDLPSLREVLRNEENALLVEPGSPKAVARAIDRLIGDSALQSTLGANALRDARRFTWAARAETIANFIRARL